MNPLEPLLRPLASLMNRRIRTNSAALELCEQLAGRRIAVRVTNTALSMQMNVNPDGVAVSLSVDDDPGVLIEGSLLSLTALAGDDPMAAIRDGRVRLAGDAQTAEGFQRLLKHARPNLEDDLSAVFGDTAGKVLSDVAHSVHRFGSEQLKSAGEAVSERVVKDQALPTKDDMEVFSDGVRNTRDHVDRLAARIDVLSRANES